MKFFLNQKILSLRKKKISKNYNYHQLHLLLEMKLDYFNKKTFPRIHILAESYSTHNYPHFSSFTLAKRKLTYKLTNNYKKEFNNLNEVHYM